MTIASLGIELTGVKGFRDGVVNLDAFTKAADKAEHAAAGLPNATKRASDGVRKLGTDSGFAAAAIERMTARSLTGFEAIAHRSGQEAEYLTKQMQKLSMTDIRSGDIAAYGQEMDRLRARFNPLFAAQQRFEAITLEINNAQRVGAITANEATNALHRERVAYEATTAAIRANTSASAGNIAVKRGGAGGLQTSNIAAQFQDIGVTAAMGMSPTMIALQQGTQLSAALGNNGLKGTVTALGAAFASVISPVSLLTIATVGLGAAGVQALMGMMNSTDDASTALERHSTWLDKILVGYKSARDAANEAAGAASKLPQQAVESNLYAEQRRNQEDFTSKLEATSRAQQELNRYTQQWIEQRAQWQQKFPDDERAIARFDRLIEVAQDLNQVEISAQSTAAEIDRFISRATELYNAAEDPAVRQQAQDMIRLGEEALAAQGILRGTTAAIAELKAQSPINIAINVATDQATAAIERLQQLRPELRTPGQVARDNAAAALSQGRAAPDAILRQAAEQEYAKTIAAIEEMERRDAALKASRAGAKSFDSWGSTTGQMRERIEAMQLEMQLFGQSTFEVDRQTKAFELNNAAKAAGIPITDTVKGQINALATDYATASAQLEAHMERQRAWQEQMDFGKGVMKGFIGDLRAGLSDGVLGWDDWANAGVNALNKVADRALSMAVDGIFDMIFGSVFGGPGGAMGANSQTIPWSEAA